MNKVLMIGRLTRDPEIRWTSGSPSTAVASFSIAVDRRFKKDGGTEADFFECSAWGKLAEHMEKYWNKGMKAAICGRLENNNWTDRDGNRRTSTRIVVEEIDFCEKKEDRDRTPDPAKPGEFMDLPDGDEELPFNF